MEKRQIFTFRGDTACEIHDEAPRKAGTFFEDHQIAWRCLLIASLAPAPSSELHGTSGIRFMQLHLIKGLSDRDENVCLLLLVIPMPSGFLHVKRYTASESKV